jgi:hypothetical protein
MIRLGHHPCPPAEAEGTAIEVDRLVNRFGSINLAGRQLLVAEILAGRQVSIRIDYLQIANARRTT